MSSFPPITVRPATPSDGPAIAHVHHTAWQESYAHLPALLATRTLPQRQAQWSHSLVHGFPWPDTKCFVAEAPDVVGFILAGPTETGMEVYSLYVLASHHGMGPAQALMRAATEGPCVVWLLEDNERARAFYQKMGFTTEGGEVARRVDSEKGLVEVRMSRG